METGLKIGKFGLIGLVWLFIILTITGSVDELTLIQFSMALFYLIVIVTVGFAIFNFAENPKAGVKFLIGFVLLGLILFIGYSVSTDYIDPETNEIVSGSKFTEGGIYTFITLFFLAVALIIASEFKRLLKL